MAKLRRTKWFQFFGPPCKHLYLCGSWVPNVRFSYELSSYSCMTVTGIYRMPAGLWA